MELSARYPRSEWLYGVLASIEANPQQQLEASDVRSLDLYVLGYQHGLESCGRDDDDALLQAFFRWLPTSGHVPPQIRVTPSMGWVFAVEVIDPSGTNVLTFFRLLKQFLQEAGLPPLNDRNLAGREPDPKVDARARARSITEMLRTIAVRPGMHLGAENVHSLSLLLRGFLRARRACGQDHDDSLLVGFGRWLQVAGHVIPTPVNPELAWHHAIDLIDPSDKNIRTFYRLLDQYLEAKGLPPL